MSQRPPPEEVLDTVQGEVDEAVEEVGHRKVDDEDGGGGPAAVEAKILSVAGPRYGQDCQKIPGNTKQGNHQTPGQF